MTTDKNLETLSNALLLSHYLIKLASMFHNATCTCHISSLHHVHATHFLTLVNNPPVKTLPQLSSALLPIHRCGVQHAATHGLTASRALHGTQGVGAGAGAAPKARRALAGLHGCATSHGGG
jgi:hypothetical protein